MSWDVAGKRELQTVRAGVASHEQDVVVETANWENQHLPLKGRMRGGRVHLESTGARGRDVEQVELNGRILSDVEAAGEFHYTRNGQEVLSGGWQLLRQDVYRRRKAALEPAE
jgi:hypothetical protein